MNKLSKIQPQEKEFHRSAIESAHVALDIAISGYNDEAALLWDKVEKARTKYVDTVNAAN